MVNGDIPLRWLLLPFYNDKRGRVTIGVLLNVNLIFKNKIYKSRPSCRDMVLTCCLDSIQFDRNNMLRHKRIMLRHIALGFLYDAGSCHGILISILYFQLIWSYFVFSLILLFKYHLQDKNIKNLNSRLLG